NPDRVRPLERRRGAGGSGSPWQDHHELARLSQQPAVRAPDLPVLLEEAAGGETRAEMGQEVVLPTHFRRDRAAEVDGEVHGRKGHGLGPQAGGDRRDDAIGEGSDAERVPATPLGEPGPRGDLGAVGAAEGDATNVATLP